jgi:hypothetical protein
MGPTLQIISESRIVKRNCVHGIELRLKNWHLSASQEIIHLSTILTFICGVHKSLPLNFILSKLKPIHNFIHFLSKSAGPVWSTSALPGHELEFVSRPARSYSQMYNDYQLSVIIGLQATPEYLKLKPPRPESASELYRPIDCRLTAKLVPTFCG